MRFALKMDVYVHPLKLSPLEERLGFEPFADADIIIDPDVDRDARRF
jgi:hypothetical protein